MSQHIKRLPSFVCLDINNKYKPLDGKAVKVCMAIQQAMLRLQSAVGDGLDLQIFSHSFYFAPYSNHKQ